MFMRLRYALGIVQINSATGELEVGGLLVTGISENTWAGKPAATDVAMGAIIRTPASEFVSTNVPLEGMYHTSDQVKWKPYGIQVLAEHWGLDAGGIVISAANGLTTARAFTLPGGVPTLLDGQAYVGMKIKVRAIFKTIDGANTATYSLHYGTAGTTSDAVIAYATATAIADRDTAIECECPVVSSTKILSPPLNAYNNSGQTNIVLDKTITSGSGIVHKITISVTPASTTDTFQLTGYRIELLP